MKMSGSFKALFAMGTMSMLLAGCGGNSALVSERKQDVDKQKEIQKDLVDRRTAELKADVDRQTSLDVRTLEENKKVLALKQHAIDEDKKAVEKRADFEKKDIDKQSSASKKIVDRNADVAKTQLDEFARTHK